MGFQKLVAPGTPRLVLEGVREHNLKNVSVEIPLQRLVCVTGVSGSGKSTLVQDVLAPALMRHFGRSTESPGQYDRMLGAELLADVVFVDQSPIGKTARSNPVSYVGAWDAIRELFANAALSRQRGYTASKFSFNSGDGRCATCGGSGFEHVEMQFLSDVYLPGLRRKALSAGGTGGADRAQASGVCCVGIRIGACRRRAAGFGETARCRWCGCRPAIDRESYADPAAGAAGEPSCQHECGRGA